MTQNEQQLKAALESCQALIERVLAFDDGFFEQYLLKKKRVELLDRRSGYSPADSLLTSIVSSLKRAEDTLENCKRKRSRLLPDQKREKLRKALERLEEEGECWISEPCNCGSMISHNNGGNYHTEIELKKSEGKYYVRYGSTSEFESYSDWSEGDADMVKDIIEDHANWL